MDLVDSVGQVGSGALPIEKVPSVAVCIRPRSCSVDDLARRLRTSALPVIGYTRDNALHLDVRTVSPDDIAVVAQAVRSALGGEV